MDPLDTAASGTGPQPPCRRRWLTRPLTLTVAAAVVASSGIAYAVAGHASAPHPTLTAAPSVAPTAPPTPAASASPSPSPTRSTPPAPDGRISLTELGNTTLDIPAWPAGGQGATFCPTGRRKFTGGTNHMGDVNKLSDPYSVTLIKAVAYADVDHDGAQETAALVDCRLQAEEFQVVLFDRDTTGHIVTVGQLLAESKTVRHMFAIRGQTDGTVSVQVGDLDICCSTTPQMVEHQWRTYTWNGPKGVQVSGPTSFHPTVAPNDVQLSVTQTQLRLGPVKGGVRTATMTVTVTNHDTHNSPGTRLVFDFYKPFPLDGTATLPANKKPAITLKGCQTAEEASNGTAFDCHKPGLPAGASYTYTYTVTSSASNDTFMPSGETGYLASVFLQEEQPGIRVLPMRYDSNFTGGVGRQVEIPIRRDS